MEIRYGAGGMPMVNQPKKVEPVEETAKPENKKQEMLQEILEENPNQKFCIGVQWHPEFLIDDKDLEIFKALVESSRKN